MRFEKRKLGDTIAVDKHHERKKEAYKSNPDIKKELSSQNYHFKNPTASYAIMADERISKMGCNRKKDSVILVDTFIGGSPEFLNKMKPDEQRNFLKHGYDFLIKNFGEENIIAATVHMNEKTPHMHVVFTPITQDGRLSAKEILGNRQKYSQWQDKFYAHVKEKYPTLERGEPAKETGRKHLATYKFKAVTKEIEDVKIRLLNSDRDEAAFLTNRLQELQSQLKVSNFEKPEARLSFREKLALDIDENIYFSENFDDLLKRLQEKGYTITRQGVKYVSVKPPNANRAIRLKSLGEDYTEDALKLRIKNKDKFQNSCKNKIEETRGMEKEFNVAVGETIKLYYKRKISPRKAKMSEPYAFYNDYRINKMINCLKVISADNLNSDNLAYKKSALEVRAVELRKMISEEKKNCGDTLNLIKSAEDYFNGNASPEVAKRLNDCNIKSEFDFEVLKRTFTENEAVLNCAQDELSAIKERLETYEKISEIAEEINQGSYVDKLIAEELARDDFEELKERN